jgi:hypothetical protein
MNKNLEPREVERPFIGRWMRTSLELIVRSPVQFGLIVVLLMCLDNGVVELASGYRIEKLWANALGSLLLGFIWVFIAALARGADETSRTWSALAQFIRPRVWVGAVASAAVAVCFELMVRWLLNGVTGLDSITSLRHGKPTSFLQHPGDVVSAISHDAMFFTAVFEPFYFPLLAAIPGISPRQAHSLSMFASRKNGKIEILLGVGIVVVAMATLAQIAPVFGLIDAATVLFVGVFNYVAYRDVFERRSGNAPLQVAVGRMRPTFSDRQEGLAPKAP